MVEKCCAERLDVALATDLDGAFEQLVQVYQHRLYGFALRLAGSPQEAEEIAQDAFVRAYRALCGFSRDRILALNLRPWLYRITLNVFRNRVRGVHLYALSLDDALDGECLLDGLEDVESDRPEALLLETEQRREVATLIAALPPRLRAAVVLRHVEGFSYAQVAEITRVPLNTAKSDVRRGTQLLRNALRPALSEVR